MFNDEEFKKNKIHYKNYNEEIDLPISNYFKTNMVKRIKEFRSQIVLKMKNKCRKKNKI